MASLELPYPVLAAVPDRETPVEAGPADAGERMEPLPLPGVPVTGEPIAAEAAAQVASEAAVTAEAMVQIASVAATNVIAKASRTAEVAQHLAAVAAADIVADAEVVADAMVVAAASAANAAQRVRHAVAGAITAEAASRQALADTAQQLSEELTRRIDIEARLLAQEAELTAFAGMVAHDLKAPLRAVGGFTRMLRRDLAASRSSLPDGPDQAISLGMDKIVAAVDRMSMLIDDLLAFVTARDRILEFQRVDLGELVAQVIAEHAAGREGDKPTPTIVVGPLPSVQADPGMCRQLLDNLIGNALKYTAPGAAAHVIISSREDAGMVRVEIIDHGVGVPQGQHELVFTALHRSHAGYAGTGLGLAICQRIVHRHGGTIGVTDNIDGGSNFHFTLPASADTEPFRSIETDPGQGPPNNPAAP